MNDWTYFIETYGCKVNQYETQALREAWNRLGGREATDAAGVDYILINSCAITARAERDARNAIYRLRRKAPAAKIILCGCAAQFFGDFIPGKEGLRGRPDICISQSHKALLLSGPCADLCAGSAGSPFFSISSYTRGRAVVKIQDGCTQRCTYCIVPSTRVTLASRLPEDVLAECRALFDSGFCEIVISGVNLRQYGVDNPSCGDFWSLLTWLDKQLWPLYGDSKRLRISSVEPAQLTEAAFAAIQGGRMICPQLHLSLQHASQTILRRMGRGHYTAAKVLDFMASVRKFSPYFGLGIDIIAGFPGESGADLRILLDFLDKLQPAYAHVFPYSRRPGTPAATFTGQIERRTRLARAQLIRQKIADLKKIFLQKQLECGSMLIAPDSNFRPGAMRHGVNEFYAPCFFDLPENLDLRVGLLSARPLRIGPKGLEVEICGAVSHRATRAPQKTD